MSIRHLTLVITSSIFLTLFSFSSSAQDKLKKVGQCEKTQIESIGVRMAQLPDSGTVIVYTNDIAGFSWVPIKKVHQSRVGDPIRLCLVSIPKGCPKGDDRGKLYIAVNLRTGARWRHYDSLHNCGGA